MRGEYTQTVQTIAEKHGMGQIGVTEIRLIAYVQFVMCNDQKIDPRKINWDEKEVLRKWKDAGHIEGGATGLAVTKEFWNYMCEILFEAYVKGAAKDEAREFMEDIKEGLTK